MALADINKDKEEAAVFEDYGFKWVNTSLYDDESYGAGYWLSSTHKLIPIQHEDYIEFEIYETVMVNGDEVLDGDIKNIVKHEDDKLVYRGGIEIEDREFVYKLFLNLCIIFEEPYWDDDDCEPVL
jgi:hypothetical protein